MLNKLDPSICICPAVYVNKNGVYYCPQCNTEYHDVNDVIRKKKNQSIEETFEQK
jgi:uncharacterized Zn finger protein (UPF0148 family)